VQSKGWSVIRDRLIVHGGRKLFWQKRCTNFEISQHNTTQHNTTQHSTTQHNTTQGSCIQMNRDGCEKFMRNLLETDS